VTSLVATSAAASDRDDRRPVHRTTDPATGAEIRVSQTGPRAIHLEVSNDSVEIQRDLEPVKSVTTIKTAAGTVRLTVGRGGLTMTGSGGRADSEAVQRALELLTRISLPSASPSGQAVMATHAMLLSAVGDRAGARAVFDRARAALTDAAESVQTDADDEEDLNPTECWNTYAREAIAAATEFEQCLDECPWWHPTCGLGCELVYDMRAIGAFAWWLRCVGLGVNG
jgi:hypothetical protein